jgi:hypothetical protein
MHLLYLNNFEIDQILGFLFLIFQINFDTPDEHLEYSFFYIYYHHLSLIT